MIDKILLLAALLAVGACDAHTQQAPSGTAPTSTKTTPAPAPAAAATAPAPPPTLRLGDAARPTRYRAKLVVVPTEPRFTATIDIDVQLRAPTTTLWLNASRLEFARAAVPSAPDVTARVIAGGKDFVGITFSRALGPGPVTVRIDYSGEITDKASDGLFRQQEGGKWYVFTHFEPIDARRVFPCFDEPLYKTPWEIALEVPSGDVALSNAPERSSQSTRDGKKLVQFAPTKPLPSYLVALAVGDFDFADAGPAGARHVPVRIVTPKGRAAEARYARETTPQVIDRLEQYFGTPYPYEKLDLIDVPVIGGAMENPGLVTFSQRIILAKPQDETVRFRHGFTATATHELAHQWFGDLVTTAWWDDIWLNEAFASWMTPHILEEWKPDWHLDAEAADNADYAMTNDALVSARSIRQPIRSNDDMVNAFDGITYEKGAAVIGMFERWVGPERFQAGIRRYLAAHAFGAATADDFLAAIDAEAKTAVDAAWRTFLEQPGVPLVSLALSCPAGAAPSLRVTQERYRPAGSTGAAPERWQLPLCVRYDAGSGKEARSCALVTDADATLPLPEAHGCPAFVVGNDRQSGYYRVRYEGALWPHVVGGVARLGLPERVGLVSDATALVRSGKLPYADALPLAQKLGADDNRAVASNAIALVEMMRDLDLVPDALRPRYARFVRATFGARAQKLGFVPRAGETDDTRLLRPRFLWLLADRGEDASLKKQARALALRWLDDRGAVDAELAPVVLSMAALDGDGSLLARYTDEAKKPTTTRLDRTRLLNAMGSFHRADVAKAALAVTLSPDFDARESLNILYALTSAPATRQLGWEFLQANFDALAGRLSPRWAAFLPQAAKSFCDAEHARDIQAFFAGRATRFIGGPRILAQTVETVQLCSAERATQLDGVAAFLRRR